MAALIPYIRPTIGFIHFRTTSLLQNNLTSCSVFSLDNVYALLGLALANSIQIIHGRFFILHIMLQALYIRLPCCFHCDANAHYCLFHNFIFPNVLKLSHHFLSRNIHSKKHPNPNRIRNTYLLHYLVLI